jgi:Pyridoxamine 5'-phosphate oxidase
MPVWGLWREGAVLFSTAPTSVKARNLERDPRLVVHLESGDDVVTLEGKAEQVAIDDAVADAYEAKYDYRPQLEGLWLQLRPVRAYAWTSSCSRSRW